jgi:hypothetical protein
MLREHGIDAAPLPAEFLELMDTPEGKAAVAGGAGFARSLSHRWPEPERTYHTWQQGAGAGEPPFSLGEVRVVRVAPDVWVAILLAKDHPHAPGAPPMVRYDALDQSLAGLAGEAVGLGASVHMPRIACGVGGGDWGQVQRMVEHRLCSAGVPVTVYDQ